MVLRKLFLLAEEAISSTSNIEARVALISVTLITVSIYISSFNIFISLLAVITALISCRSLQKILKGLAASSPFLIFFVVSSYILGGDIIYAVKVTLGLIALVSAGIGILYGMHPEDLTFALVYFCFPYRYAFLVSLSFRMFQIFLRDVVHVIEALQLSGERGLKYYKKLLKTIASIAVLRSISISETLYSRGFSSSNRIQMKKRKLVKFDYCLLLISAMIFVLSVLPVFNDFNIYTTNF